MPFNLDQALTATRPVSVKYAGQTLTMQVFCCRMVPTALSEASLADARADHMAAREQARLEAVNFKALETYAAADAPALKAATVALDKADAASVDFGQRENQRRLRALARELTESVKEWDAARGDGSPFPVDADFVFNCWPWQLITEAHAAATSALTEKE